MCSVFPWKFAAFSIFNRGIENFPPQKASVLSDDIQKALGPRFTGTHNLCRSTWFLGVDRVLPKCWHSCWQSMLSDNNRVPNICFLGVPRHNCPTVSSVTLPSVKEMASSETPRQWQVVQVSTTSQQCEHFDQNRMSVFLCCPAESSRKVDAATIL